MFFANFGSKKDSWTCPEAMSSNSCHEIHHKWIYCRDQILSLANYTFHEVLSGPTTTKKEKSAFWISGETDEMRTRKAMIGPPKWVFFNASIFLATGNFSGAVHFHPKTARFSWFHLSPFLGQSNFLFMAIDGLFLVFDFLS